LCNQLPYRFRLIDESPSYGEVKGSKDEEKAFKNTIAQHLDLLKKYCDIETAEIVGAILPPSLYAYSFKNSHPG
jgi:hypothetical protein